jgi:NAD(P)-dependent dehydrogenase (short-subunit alcohol dehydrogenase family)
MATAPEQASKPSGDWSQLLTDKVVFVTGAGGGIGAAIVQACFLHGARVVIADINKNAADEVASNILNGDTDKKDYVMAIELDVTDEQQIQNAVKAVVEKWNTIDVLVNKYVHYLSNVS